VLISAESFVLHAVIWVAAARPKALPMAEGQTIGAAITMRHGHILRQTGKIVVRLRRLWKYVGELGIVDV
jgi:hypothetical protein